MAAPSPALCAAASVAWSQVHVSVINPLIGREITPAGDEIVIMSITVGSLLALMLPYALTFMTLGISMVIAWVALDLPLGPGHEPLFIEAVR